MPPPRAVMPKWRYPTVNLPANGLPPGKRSGRHPDLCTMSVGSGPPRELPRLRLGHAAAGCVATDTGFGVSDIQLHLGWELQPNRVAVVLMQLDDGSFHDKVQSVPDHLAGKGEDLEALLVHEVETTSVAV